MKYRVTTVAGEQTEVESDLPLAFFAQQFSASTDIHPLPAEEPVAEEPVAEEPVAVTDQGEDDAEQVEGAA